MSDSFEQLFKDIVEWQNQVFTQATSQSRVEHLYREARELKENPSDAAEMADVLFLLVGLAAGEGVNLLEAGRKKLEINKRRQWGQPDAQGVVEHVRMRVVEED